MTKQLTTKKFVEKAILVHDNRYDYSLIEYKNAKTKVKIICPEHGIFKQTPSNHLSEYGCSDCGMDSIKEKLKLTKEEFIEKANLVHKNKYDYSQVEYVNRHAKIKINCSIHGIFEQTPSNHLSEQGCPKCGKIASNNKRKLLTEEFIKKANEIHNNFYDYSLIEYQNNHTNINIKCKIHGEFLQTPGNHLAGKGCSKCGLILVKNKLKFSTEEFIKKAQEIHKDLYDYSLVEYLYSGTKVQIICPKHGIFEQTPNGHLAGKGCKFCATKPVSNIETQFLDFMGISQNCRQQDVYIRGKSFRVDGYIEFFDLKIVIKLLGNYWHGNPDRFNTNDINPKLKCAYGELYQETIDRLKLFRENGYKVIYIWENEFKNLLKFNKKFGIT